MEAKDVRNLSWTKVEDWSDLPETVNSYGTKYVSENDLNTFVENLFKEIARKLSITYEELFPILKIENNAFYLLKNRLYSSSAGYGKNDPELRSLESTLRVPDLTARTTKFNEQKVSCCLKFFDELSSAEKLVFLQEIGKIDIKIEQYNVHKSDINIVTVGPLEPR